MTLLNGLGGSQLNVGVIKVVPAVVMRRVGGVVTGSDAIAVMDDDGRQVVQRRLRVAAVVAGFMLVGAKVGFNF